MNHLSAEALGQSFGEEWIFRNITFGLTAGDKVGLIGANGTGKSTFLRILAGEQPPQEGKVSVRNGISIGYLPQSPLFEGSASVLEVIFSGNNPMALAMAQYEQAMLANDSGALTHASEEMERLKAWDFEARARIILGKLGIQDENALIGTLSGGQKKRVALAHVLLQEPDLLILDEPTNHLDIEMVEWFEDYLTTQSISLLLVTHDRYFLDKVTNQIVELDSGSLQIYKGNYAYFLEKKSEHEASEYADTNKARNRYRKELEWIRRQPKARGTKSRYRVEAFSSLEEKAKQRKFDDKIEMNVRSERLGNKILELQSVGKKFGTKEIVHNFLYTFKKGDRIGIVGPNGVGKTTLLKLITGEIRPDNGQVVKGDTVRFGYYTQTELVNKEGQRVSELVKEQADVVRLGSGETVTVSRYLQSFLFNPSKQHGLIEKLSGGEKRRLQLSLMLMREPNFLILDEPTNDLDIVSLQVLEEFLANFTGCVIIVSHDRYFMDRLVDHLFIFGNNGQIKDFPGNYTDYRNHMAQESSELAVIKTVQKTNKPGALQNEVQKDKRKKASFKEMNEFEKLTKDIALLEGDKKELLKQMGLVGDHTKLQEMAMAIEQIDETLPLMELRWLELSEII